MKRISTFVSSALVQELRCCSPTSSAYTGALDIHTAIQIHKPARCFPRCFLHSLSTLVYYEWMVTNASEFINDIKIWGSLGCRDRALVEFTVLRDMGKERSIVRTLIFRKAKFQLFKELVNRTPWKTVLRDREQKRGGRSLRMLCIECKSFQSPGVRNHARKGKDQHGWVETCWSN